MSRSKTLEPVNVRAIAWGLIDIDDKAAVNKQERKVLIQRVRREMDGSGYYLHVGVPGTTNAYYLTKPPDLDWYALRGHGHTHTAEGADQISPAHRRRGCPSRR